MAAGKSKPGSRSGRRRASAPKSSRQPVRQRASPKRRGARKKSSRRANPPAKRRGLMRRLFGLPFWFVDAITRHWHPLIKWPARAGGYVGVMLLICFMLVALVYYARAARYDMGRVAEMPARTLVYGRDGRTELGRLHGVIMDFNTRKRDGVSLKEVMPGSAAHKGGLRKGDVIVALDQSEITGATEMRSHLQRLRPGSKIGVSYVRAGAQRNTTVRLGSLAENSTIRRIPAERMEQMQRMGAIPSRVRSDFPSVIQSDMPIDPRDVGAPVADLDGNVVGIAIARGSRIKTFIIPTSTIHRLLGTQPQAPDKILAMETRHQGPRNAQAQRSRPRPANRYEDPIDRVKRLLRDAGR